MIIKGTVALITGGAQGFGRAFASALLQRGGRVALLDINKKKGEEFLSSAKTSYGADNCIFLPCDVTKEEELKGAFDAVKKTYGQLDIVCNNAGVMGNIHYAKVIAINLSAVVLGTHEGIKHMSKQSGGNGGVIVNVASMAGIYPLKEGNVYAATKHGVVGFTRSYERMLKNDGIRVNCLCPVFSPTQMVEDAMATHGDKFKTLMERVGMTSIESVTEGFLRLVQDEALHGEALAVSKQFGTYVVDFPKFYSAKTVESKM